MDTNRQEEDYLYHVFGHYAVFERPGATVERRSPLQRVMRQIKALRGKRYWYHVLIPGGEVNTLPDLMHESWFQLPAAQKEENLLRRVNWSGVSEATKEKLIERELRSRDGEINAPDEWRLHDQLMRVERTTANWNGLSSTAKLETLLRARDVDWRPFPPEFQALALSHMIRREVQPKAEGFRMVGVFEASTDVFRFGRYGPGDGTRDAFEQSQRKGPRRPRISKAEARSEFRWAIADSHWEAFVKQHQGEATPAQVQALKEVFRQQMRPLWQEFWEEAKKLDRKGLVLLTIRKYREIEDARGAPGQGPEQESLGSTLSLADLRADAKGRSKSDDRTNEQGKDCRREGNER